MFQQKKEKNKGVKSIDGLFSHLSESELKDINDGILKEMGQIGSTERAKFALRVLENIGVKPDQVINIAYNMAGRTCDSEKEAQVERLRLAWSNIAIIVNALDLTDDQIEAYLKDYLKKTKDFKS
jgi:hypothetical protein